MKLPWGNGDFEVSNFVINGMMMRYSIFIPKLYNYCKSLGFSAGKILPSRAFCSDESQGFPIILITKHFGCFPFNHGRVGGIVATDRHGPHTEHGKDLVIIQASHVGYDSDKKQFGVYRRLQTDQNEMTPSCGKVHSVLDWYLNEYRFARDNIRLQKDVDDIFITIDNQFLNDDRKEGLFLRLDKLISAMEPVATYSTSKRFLVSDDFVEMIDAEKISTEENQSVSDQLLAPYFYFKRDIPGDLEGHDHLENNLIGAMSTVVTSKEPLLTAAILNTQAEFDRTFRSIIKSNNYKGKKILLISGLNIDISPEKGQIFPLTKFVPWAAYIQDSDGKGLILEQDKLLEKLKEQSADNPDQIDLEQAIHDMVEAKEVLVDFK